MEDITVKELHQLQTAGNAPSVIDVRETWEFETDHIEAKNIPMNELATNIKDIEHLKDSEFIVCCRSGGRSGRMKAFLESQGFSKVRNLSGGMLAWKDEIDSSFNIS